MSRLAAMLRSAASFAIDLGLVVAFALFAMSVAVGSRKPRRRSP
ncbi:MULTISPECIES: hypothetical protein [unclassified Bradyrhizobium]|nr:MULTISPECIES: hypothetical protein [unclassified Bradyrhizobium]